MSWEITARSWVEIVREVVIVMMNGVCVDGGESVAGWIMYDWKRGKYVITVNAARVYIIVHGSSQTKKGD